MKKARPCITGILLLWSILSLAQNKVLLYNFSEIPQHLMVNPGGIPYHDMFAGIPLLSGIYARVGTNEVTVNDLFEDNGVNFNIKLRNVLNRMSSSDVIDVNEQWELLYAGFKGKGRNRHTFYSFGIYQELDAYTYFPKDLTDIAYQGNAGNINRIYDLSHLDARGEILSVFHFGWNKQVNRDLTIGLRGKLYSSLLNFTATGNSGTFITEPGEDNLLRHRVNADMALQTSGYASIKPDGVDLREILQEFPSRAFFGGNYGLGLDAGFTWQPGDSWSYAASFQDLGFVFHNNDLETYTLSGQYELEGIEFLFGEVAEDELLDDYWEELKAELEEQLPLDTIRRPYVNMRPLKLNASVTHHFGNLRYRKAKACDCELQDWESYENAIGLQLFTLYRPGHIHTAVSAIYYRRLFDFLRVKLSWTADKFSMTNIGVGVSTHFSRFNVYVLADNVLDYANLAESPLTAIQFGFNFVIPARSFRGYPSVGSP